MITSPRVTGFAVTGTPESPIVCVHVEAGEFGIWMGRRHPGLEIEVVDETAVLREITIHEAQRILATWPATGASTGDALQFAAWQGRRLLIAQLLHERVARP